MPSTAVGRVYHHLAGFDRKRGEYLRSHHALMLSLPLRCLATLLSTEVMRHTSGSKSKSHCIRHISKNSEVAQRLRHLVGALFNLALVFLPGLFVPDLDPV